MLVIALEGGEQQPQSVAGCVFIARERFRFAQHTVVQLASVEAADDTVRSVTHGHLPPTPWTSRMQHPVFAHRYSTHAQNDGTVLCEDIYIRAGAMEDLVREGQTVPGRQLLRESVSALALTNRIIRQLPDALLHATVLRDPDIIGRAFRPLNAPPPDGALAASAASRFLHHQRMFAAGARAHEEEGVECNACDGFWPLVDASQRGIYIDREGRIKLREELERPSRTLRNGLLADPPGTGKTGCVIALVSADARMRWESELPRSQATLVLAPVSAVDTWITELRLRAPELRAHVICSRRTLIETTWSDLCEPGIVVLSTALLPGALGGEHARQYGPRPPASIHSRNSELRRCSAANAPRGPAFIHGLSWRRVVVDEIHSATSASAVIELTAMLRRRSLWVLGEPPRAGEHVVAAMLLDDGALASGMYASPSSAACAPLDTEALRAIGSCVFLTAAPTPIMHFTTVHTVAMTARERADYAAASSYAARVEVCNMPPRLVVPRSAGFSADSVRQARIDTAARIGGERGAAVAQDDSVECPICFERADDEGAVLTHCAHLFCGRCALRALLLPSSRCPVCREPISSARLTQIGAEQQQRHPLALGEDSMGSKLSMVLETTPDRAVILVRSEAVARRICTRLRALEKHAFVYGGNLSCRRFALRNASIADGAQRFLVLQESCMPDGASLSFATKLFLMGNCDARAERAALSRLRRLGQRYSVEVHRLLMDETCEVDVFITSQAAVF